MPKPNAKEKYTIGVYVAILTIAILIIWGFFLKYEFKTVDLQTDDNTWQNIKEGFKEFQIESRLGIKNFQENLNRLKQSSDQVGGNVADNFVLLAQAELLKKRTVDWQAWSNGELNFKYPPDWDLAATQSSVTLSAEDDHLDFKGIKINFFDNPGNLTAREWWSSSDIEGLDSLPAKELALGTNSALKIILTGREIVYLPYKAKMAEININFIQMGEALAQTVEDFLQTISLP